MPYDIVIGRTPKDKEVFDKKGTILLGRHYVTMGQTTSLSNNIYLDMARSHVVFICGKRGAGKSYTMGVIAEGVADLPVEIKSNIAILLLDTMGIYWTMKYPNKKQERLLNEWGVPSKGLDITIFTPGAFHLKFREEGIPSDFPFTILPSEVEPEDWCESFDLSINDEYGVIIEKAIHMIRSTKDNYSIQDIIETILDDASAEQTKKEAMANRFRNADRWGIFDVKGTPIADLIKGGQVSVLDLSPYATLPNGWKIKAMVLGLVSKKLFLERMVARKKEEYQDVHRSMHLFEEDEEPKKTPLVWLVIDEAHEFLPKTGKTLASDPLRTILREGRQPGISLILASQQPGKIDTDVMTQADTVIAHRITARVDTEALGALMQSYMREGLDVALDKLPRLKGSALIFDDTNEKLFSLKIRPRFTWHGGEAPSALNIKKEDFGSM